MGLLVGCSALLDTDNAISDVERGNGAFVPFIFPWFYYFNCLSTVSVFTNEP